jgi:hypothetical protein
LILFFSSNDQNLVSDVATSAPLGDSDHEMVSFCICIGQEGTHHPSKPDFLKADYEGMDSFLLTIDWPNLFSDTSCIQEMWKVFKDIMEFAFVQYVPFRNTKPKAKNCISQETRGLLKAKKRCYQRYRHTRSQQQLLRLRAAAKAARTGCRRDRLSKETAVLESRDRRAFFKFIKSQLASKGSIPVLKNSNGVRCTDPKTKADVLSEQFSSVFITDDGNSPAFPNRTENIIDVLQITEEMVLAALLKQPTKTSMGSDNIPPIVLKRCAQALSSPLSMIFRESLRSETLPADWLDAVVVPIYKKKGSNSAPENYRPVSLTSTCCKVLESLVKQKILDYLTENGLINDLQHGFLAKKSTLTNTLSCLNKWSAAIEKGDVVHSVFLDFAKAFDTVSHAKLLQKLTAYGIQGSILNWVQAFLSGRSQKVKVGHVLSESAHVASGVPRGTVLGPLFLLYINDLPDSILTDSAFFADDSKLHTICNKDAVTDPSLLESLSNVQKWAQEWQLSLSIPKCNILCYGKVT